MDKDIIANDSNNNFAVSTVEEPVALRRSKRIAATKTLYSSKKPAKRLKRKRKSLAPIIQFDPSGQMVIHERTPAEASEKFNMMIKYIKEHQQKLPTKPPIKSKPRKRKPKSPAYLDVLNLQKEIEEASEMRKKTDSKPKPRKLFNPHQYDDED